ncbi:MAG: M14 family zinc carboxypeptidase, partial [Deferribacterota bacterium]|nr:M14 family zinc carboxypeptidase [Deferribacterota bacterium]
MRTIFCLLIFFVFYIPLIYGDLEPAKNIKLHGISNRDYYIKDVKLHNILNSNYYLNKDVDLYSPEEFYGFPLTEDQILVDYEQLLKYYQYLAKNSPYVKLENVGYSTEDRKIYQVIISSEDNLDNLGDILEKQKILSDPRIKGEIDINELINSQPMVLFVGLSIHANEITSTQMAPNFIYKLLSIQDDYLKEILDKIVLVFSVTINPDGVDRVVHWYWNTLGTKAEGTTPPFLYQKYAGHDNNRDYFMNNLAETRVWSEQLFKRLYPVIVYDIHEMGNTGPRFFVPPFDDPANPEVHSTIIRDIQLIGGAVASDLAYKNLEGVVTNGIYDMWWHGGLRPAPYYHNQIGILTEAARVNIASP